MARQNKYAKPAALKRKPVLPKRPGRNDACWCGSRKKYKICHLKADQEAAAEASQAKPPRLRDWWGVLVKRNREN
jgi:hypothetical protein